MNNMITSRLDRALVQHPIPFELHDYQREAIEFMSDSERSGIYAEVGCGKTVMSTILSFIWDEKGKSQRIVLMPPILLMSWYRWLKTVGGTGEVLIYRGTPAERRKLSLSTPNWVLMSIQIFKLDFDRITNEFAQKEVILIVDEATSIKNISSQNHKKVKQFAQGRKLMLLTGTPLSNPGDAYAYVKYVSPSVYRSKGMFDNIHVESRDFFGQVTAWRNLDLMKQNLMLNSVRILKRDVLKHLKEPVYVPIHYELDRKHKQLYEKIAEEQLLTFEDGSVIDATSASRLYNCLQQVIVNYDYFADEDFLNPAIFDIIDNALEEIKSEESLGKLLIFANYKMTNRKLLARYEESHGAVACFSDISAKQQELNVDRFCDDDSCRIMIAQPLSAGQGLNLQKACSDILFVEAPIVPKDFHQAVGRIDREGQERVPVIRVATAIGTIQERLLRNLMSKDTTVNKVQRAYKDIKDALYGK